MLFTNSKRQAKEKRVNIIVAVNKTLNHFSVKTKTRDLLQGAIGICNPAESFNSLMHVMAFIRGDFPRAEVFLFFVNAD